MSNDGSGVTLERRGVLSSGDRAEIRDSIAWRESGSGESIDTSSIEWGCRFRGEGRVEAVEKTH